MTNSPNLPAGFLHVPGWLWGGQTPGHMTKITEFASRHLLDTLSRELAFAQPRVRVYGREVAVPRLIAHVGTGYRYSGIDHPAAPWHPALAALRQRLATDGRGEFNSCLANLYRDGQDAVGWHADDERGLGPEPVIASISIGAPRLFKIRNANDGRRATGKRDTWSIVLEDGDLLIMSGRSQLDYQHAIPRTSSAVGPRINLTYRMIAA